MQELCDIISYFLICRLDKSVQFLLPDLHIAWGDIANCKAGVRLIKFGHTSAGMFWNICHVINHKPGECGWRISQTRKGRGSNNIVGEGHFNSGEQDPTASMACREGVAGGGGDGPATPDQPPCIQVGSANPINNLVLLCKKLCDKWWPSK